MSNMIQKNLKKYFYDANINKCLKINKQIVNYITDIKNVLTMLHDFIDCQHPPIQLSDFGSVSSADIITKTFKNIKENQLRT